ncbi:MAG: outer membrane protein assembly factor BamA, partial [Halobacteriovoraceae bacterium]|nr:outer membrane protein assembly factor BamA [Halobacteriovoraceae bacterium]
KYYEEKGFYLASVDYSIKKINDENIQLTFNIQEFDKVRVKQVTFLGNKAFSDPQLKDIMETREESLFSWMSGSGNFKEFNFQTDIERIKYFYKTKGYLQVNVGTPEITVSEDKKWVFITIKVNEGPMFSINEINFQGEVLFPEQELLDQLTLKSKDTYSEELLRKDIQMLTEKYQDEGYAFANVLRTLHVVPGENKVDIEFSFEKGKIAYFGKIYVKGNTKTRDKVVRRELLIREGQKFSGSALRRSKENVNRLGFFEPKSVVFNTISPKGKDDVLDVEITVKERNTGQISLGAGYSTATGAFLQASIAQNNFRGLGQNLSFSLSLSDTNKTYNIGFTEPYLFDTKWTAGFDIFSQSVERLSFSFKRKGFDLRVGYPIFDYTRLFVTYKLEDTVTKAVNDPTVDPEIENGITSSIKTSVVRDKRDNKFEPRKGYFMQVGSEYAGVGGDKKWLKNDLDARYFKAVWGDLVLRSRLFASKIEQVDGRQVPRTEKFTLGGSRNLRGYTFEAIGPESSVLVNGINTTFNSGGSFATFATLEFEHPLAREAGLKWVVFADIGDAGDYNDFKAHMDYGFGFRWFSPIGVLRFEFGYPLNPGPRDAGSQFHFDIGQLF